MKKSTFKVGDKVKILSNDLQPAMVDKVGTIKKVYPGFSEEAGCEYVYRVEVSGQALKGVACDKDLQKI